jgi:hypothetical protein
MHLLSENSDNNQGTESRQVRRQAERANENRRPKPKMGRVQRLYVALKKQGLAHALRTLRPRTKSAPCIYRDTGNEGLDIMPHMGWQAGALTEDQLKAAARVRDVGLAILGGVILVFDSDSESLELACLFHRVLDKNAGPSFIRGRPNSQRFARGYLQTAVPLKGWQITLKDKDGKEHEFETRAAGNYWVADGVHPSGVRYEYKNGDLCDWLPKLKTVGPEENDAIYREFIAEAEALGFEVIKKSSSSKRGGAHSGTAKPITDPSLHGTAEDVFKFFEAQRCDEKHAEGRPALVTLLRGLKATLGGKHWDRVWEWLSDHPDATDEKYSKGIWDTIHDSSLGTNWFETFTRSHGYTGITWSVERDFAEPPDRATAPPEYTKQMPTEIMLKNTVYVSDQNAFYDKKDGQLRSVPAFRAHHAGVAPVGSSGKNTSDAICLNTPGVCKVATLTMKPGAPVITEIDKDGWRQKALNLYRPSPLEPNLKATAADVSLYLDLVLHRALPDLQRMKLCYSAAASSASRSVFS